MLVQRVKRLPTGHLYALKYRSVGAEVLMARRMWRVTCFCLNPSITAGHYACNQTRVIIEHYIAKIFWPDSLLADC